MGEGVMSENFLFILFAYFMSLPYAQMFLISKLESKFCKKYMCSAARVLKYHPHTGPQSAISGSGDTALDGMGGRKRNGTARGHKTS